MHFDDVKISGIPVLQILQGALSAEVMLRIT